MHTGPAKSPSRRLRTIAVRFVRPSLLAAALVIAALYAAWGVVYWNETRTPRLACLMYHRFATRAEFRACHGDERLYTVDVERFESHLARLRELGYHFVRLAEAVAFVRGERDLPQPAVLITIDDGCRSVLTRAAPVLRRLGARATLFLTTDPDAYVFDEGGKEQTQLMPHDLQALAAEGTFDFGAHGVTHRPLRELSDVELAGELETSRAAIELAVGAPVEAMAVPGNWYDDRVLEFARKAGYGAVFVSDPGTNRAGDDATRVRRLNVSGDVTAATLADQLGPAAMARRRLTFALQRAVRDTLGPATAGALTWAAGVLLPRHDDRLAAAGVGLGAAIPGIIVLSLRMRARAKRRRDATMHQTGAIRP